MVAPESNGLFEVATSKTVKERGFNCMRLISFLTRDKVKDWSDWHGAHTEAAQGQCRYFSECPNFASTVKNHPIQLKLF